jgi:hypothetical protein
MKDVMKKCEVPAEIASLLKRPPILIGESRSAYEAIFFGFVKKIEPQDIIEWFLLNDVVNYTWDICRLDKSKSVLINTIWKEALRMILESCLPQDEQDPGRTARKLAEDWFATSDGQFSVIELLRKYHLDEGAVDAQAMVLRLPELGEIDRKLERARVARIRTLAEIERYRIAGSWKMPKKLPQLIDAEIQSTSVVPSLDQAGQQK